jgi:glyoxylase-like metal-dependent hydrolase (beta-lactamase superfamily II)
VDTVADPPNGEDFVRIRADNPGPMTLTGTNTYVVGRNPAWVIDPGPDDEQHMTAIRAEGEVRGGVGGVLLTHSHADHSAGVERLGAPLRWGAVSSIDETNWRPDHDRRPANDAPAGFEVLPTPGHAADHAAFVWGDTCFCGDIILGEGSTIVPPAAFGGSLGDYLESLDRLRDLDASLFAPGHGEWITDPAAKIAEYVSHRAERERKLIAALDSGERSRAALLAAAWADVPEGLRPAAAMAMQAHLEKLEADGRVDGTALTA